MCLAHFVSPKNESSLFKGVPNTDHWHSIVKCFMEKMGIPYTIRYRGPRINGNTSDCAKIDAYSFAVYARENVTEFSIPSSLGATRDLVNVLIAEMTENGATFLEYADNTYTFKEWLDCTELHGHNSWSFPNYYLYRKYCDEITEVLEWKPAKAKILEYFAK